jgi:hypothetical protein
MTACSQLSVDKSSDAKDNVATAERASQSVATRCRMLFRVGSNGRKLVTTGHHVGTGRPANSDIVSIPTLAVRQPCTLFGRVDNGDE